jgi:hypothetical protein
MRPNPQEERLRQVLMPRERDNFGSLAAAAARRRYPPWAGDKDQQQRHSTASSALSPEDYQARIAERDARLAADTRDAIGAIFRRPGTIRIGTVPEAPHSAVPSLSRPYISRALTCEQTRFYVDLRSRCAATRQPTEQNRIVDRHRLMANKVLDNNFVSRYNFGHGKGIIAAAKGHSRSAAQYVAGPRTQMGADQTDTRRTRT